MPEYTFKVLCSSDSACEYVRSNLISEGFESVRLSRSVTSDLEGTKQFRNEKEALAKARQFYNKHGNKVLEILTIENA